jgi:hypothetical protein
VAVVADEQDLEVVAGEAHRLAVHLRHERTGGVDRLKAPIGCRVHDGGRDAVRAEDDVGAFGHLVDLLDEDGPFASSSVTTWMLCTICLRT